MLQPSGIVDFHDWHAYALAMNMRADEIEQYLAFTGEETFDFEEAARRFISFAGVKFTLMDEGGDPIICGGFYPVAPGVWRSWMAGTMEGWEKHWRRITKASRWLIEEMFKTAHARRLETSALASRIATLAWYEKSLGLVREGVWEDYAGEGRHVVGFALTRRAFYGQ